MILIITYYWNDYWSKLINYIDGRWCHLNISYLYIVKINHRIYLIIILKNKHITTPIYKIWIKWFPFNMILQVVAYYYIKTDVWEVISLIQQFGTMCDRKSSWQYMRVEIFWWQECNTYFKNVLFVMHIMRIIIFYKLNIFRADADEVNCNIMLPKIVFKVVYKLAISKIQISNIKNYFIRLWEKVYFCFV